MRETRTSGSMSGVRRRSDGAERGTDEIAKAFGNSYSPFLWQPRLTPTLPSWRPSGLPGKAQSHPLKRESKGELIMATGTVRLHRVLRAKAERVYRAFLDADAM